MKKAVALTIVLALIFNLAFFSFSEPSNWAQAEVDEARQKNLLVAEADQNFQNNITRQLFCKLVVQMIEQARGAAVDITTTNPFDDTADAAIIKAYQLGIVKGVSKTAFAPNNLISRQEVAVMMMRAFRLLDDMKGTSYTKNLETDNLIFNDQAAIASWALADVKAAYALGVVKGVGDKRIAPLGNATIEQSVLLSLRLFNRYANDVEVVKVTTPVESEKPQFSSNPYINQYIASHSPEQLTMNQSLTRAVREYVLARIYTDQLATGVDDGLSTAEMNALYDKTIDQWQRVEKQALILTYDTEVALAQQEAALANMRYVLGDEDIKWAEEFSKKFDSLKGAHRIKQLAKLMHLDVKRTYKLLMISQDIIDARAKNDEAALNNAYMNAAKILKTGCKVAATVLAAPAAGATTGATVMYGIAVTDVATDVITTEAEVILGDQDKLTKKLVDIRDKVGLVSLVAGCLYNPTQAIENTKDLVDKVIFYGESLFGLALERYFSEDDGTATDDGGSTNNAGTADNEAPASLQEILENDQISENELDDIVDEILDEIEDDSDIEIDEEFDEMLAELEKSEDADKAGDLTADNTTKPTGEDVTKPTAENTTKPTGEETTEPTGEDVTEPTGEDTTEPTGEDVSEATGEDTTKSTAEDESAPTEDESAPTEDESAPTEDESASTEDESASTEDESESTEDESESTEDESASTEDESASTGDTETTTTTEPTTEQPPADGSCDVVETYLGKYHNEIYSPDTTEIYQYDPIFPDVVKATPPIDEDGEKTIFSDDNEGHPYIVEYHIAEAEEIREHGYYDYRGRCLDKMVHNLYVHYTWHDDVRGPDTVEYRIDHNYYKLDKDNNIGALVGQPRTTVFTKKYKWEYLPGIIQFYLDEYMEYGWDSCLYEFQYGRRNTFPFPFYAIPKDMLNQ